MCVEMHIVEACGSVMVNPIPSNTHVQHRAMATQGTTLAPHANVTLSALHLDKMGLTTLIAMFLHALGNAFLYTFSNI